jgi:S-adenosylmethionine:tRNA ribosyltransferase-isomerase
MNHLLREIINIPINDYDYELPEERIAKFPLEKRDTSKLLVFKDNKITEGQFFHLKDYIPTGSLMVFNNTKVIQARLVFQKNTGAKIELFCLEPIIPAEYVSAFQQTESVVWQCMVGNFKKWKGSPLQKEMHVGDKQILLFAEIIQHNGLTSHVRFSWNSDEVTFSQILEAFGELPIPPYLHRPTCEKDNETYQTIYSKIKGSVAAPTAGLHFTPEVIDNLLKNSVQIEELTLHIGAGTFHPVKSEKIEGHEMHTEFISVTKSTIKNIMDNLGKIIAVGTTSVRTLESLYYIGLQLQESPNKAMCELNVSQWMPYTIDNEIDAVSSLNNILLYLERNKYSRIEVGTQIMIAPGYNYKIISGLLTNFHQPKSTLLLLVSALVGNRWKDIYKYALEHDFRFLSYGDSSLLMR